MNKVDNNFDVIIIGSGLSGLTAALHIQNNDKRVLIVEKRAKAGGLCGTEFIDGYEFVIACNEFGSIIESQMNALDVPVQFKPVSMIYWFDKLKITLPPRLSDYIKLIPHIFDLVRLSVILKRQRLDIEHHSLDKFISHSSSNKRLQELLKAFGYPYARALEDLALKTIFNDFSKEANYGFHRMVIPIGGPGNIIDNMVKKFLEQGGTIYFNTECRDIITENNKKIVVTTQGNYITKNVITSQNRWDEYPDNFKSGFPLSVIYLAVDKRLNYPKNIHTMVYFPPDISSWLSALDNGYMPDLFGWHIFTNDSIAHDSYYTLNIYFYTPRGIKNFAENQRQKIEKNILNRAERMLPGLNDSILYKRFLSPMNFEEIHGFSSHPIPIIIPQDHCKLGNYDEKKGIYYIGNSVLPYGEHAGGAILSGVNVASQINSKVII